MIFEISIIAISLIFLLIFYKFNRNVLKVYGLTFVAVLLFEYFTQALWLNKGLESWAYLYLDVSWVITLGWTTIIVIARELSALYFKKYNEKLKIIIDLIFVTIIGFFAEWVVLGLKIREYSSAVLNIASGIKIGPVPIEALYYIPVFMLLVLTFTFYWEKQLFHMDGSLTNTRKLTK